MAFDQGPGRLEGQERCVEEGHSTYLPLDDKMFFLDHLVKSNKKQLRKRFLTLVHCQNGAFLSLAVLMGPCPRPGVF